VETVRSLAAEGGDWYFYDQNFRNARSHDLPSYPWSAISWELYMAAKHRGRPQLGSTSSDSFKHTGATKQPFRKGGYHPTSSPQGTCFRFHKGMGCHTPNCKYSHVCYKCNGGSHPASGCTKRSPAIDSQTTSSRPSFKHPSKASNSGQSTSTRYIFIGLLSS
jgi:hypothetical protein